MIIHIIQKSEDIIESIIIDSVNISEISFVHPITSGEKINNDYATKPMKSTIEILYINGERRNIDTETPTVFRIAEEDEIIVETSVAQQFEKEYLSLLADALSESGE